MKQIVVLLGAKGSGKSSLSRLLERAFGLEVLSAEPLWVEHAKRPRGPNWERDGFCEVAGAVQDALEVHDVVVTETTGTSPHTAEFVGALRRQARVVVIGVQAPPELCLERVRARDAAGHVAVSDDDVEHINARAATSHLKTDATLVNASAWNEGDLRRLLHTTLTGVGVAVTPRVAELCTARLQLRAFCDDDREAFAEMNADARVTEFLSRSSTREQSDELLGKLQAHFERHGFGLWAVEVPGVAPFVGFVGLNVPHFETHFTPCVEVGWRLAAEHWGRGYATEGAERVLAFAFQDLLLPEIVSFTVPQNQRSRNVMQKLGMQLHPEDAFEHPGLPEGHPLRPHILYRLSRRQWLAHRAK